MKEAETMTRVKHPNEIPTIFANSRKICEAEPCHVAFLVCIVLNHWVVTSIFLAILIILLV